MNNIKRISACLLLAGASVSTQAQVVTFQSTPVTNACQAGWYLVPQASTGSCGGGLPSGGATVLSCNVVRIISILDNGFGYVYTPTTSSTYLPVDFCTFDLCTPQAINMTCFITVLENGERKIANQIKMSMPGKPASVPASGKRQ